MLWGWSLPECFASSQVLLHPPSMSGRWHRHLTWSCEPRENTLPCVWWGNSPTPYKHRHTGLLDQHWRDRSTHPGRTEVIHLLSSTRQQAQAVTHPSTNRGQCCLTCRIWLRTVRAMPLHHITCWGFQWLWMASKNPEHTWGLLILYYCFDRGLSEGGQRLQI